MLKHNKYKLLNWSNSIEGLCQHIYRTLKVAHDILQGQLAIGMKHNYKIILIQWSSSYSLTHFNAMVYMSSTIQNKKSTVATSKEMLPDPGGRIKES